MIRVAQKRGVFFIILGSSSSSSTIHAHLVKLSMLFPVHHTDKANGFGVPAKKIQSSGLSKQNHRSSSTSNAFPLLIFLP
jgi:hypothetical protein